MSHLYRHSFITEATMVGAVVLAAVIFLPALPMYLAYLFYRFGVGLNILHAFSLNIFTVFLGIILLLLPLAFAVLARNDTFPYLLLLLLTAVFLAKAGVVQGLMYWYKERQRQITLEIQETGEANTRRFFYFRVFVLTVFSYVGIGFAYTYHTTLWDFLHHYKGEGSLIFSFTRPLINLFTQDYILLINWPMRIF